MRFIILKAILPLQIIVALMFWLFTWFYPLYLININIVSDAYVLSSVSLSFNDERFCYLNKCYQDTPEITSTKFSMESQVGFTYEGTFIDTFGYTARYTYVLYAILLAVSILLFCWRATRIQASVLLGWALACNLSAMSYLVQYSSDVKSFLGKSLKEVSLGADISVSRQFTYAFYLHILQYLIYGLYFVLLLFFRNRRKIEFLNSGYDNI